MAGTGAGSTLLHRRFGSVWRTGCESAACSFYANRNGSLRDSPNENADFLSDKSESAHANPISNFEADPDKDSGSNDA